MGDYSGNIIYPLPNSVKTSIMLARCNHCVSKTVNFGDRPALNLRACSVVVFTNPLYTDTELDVSQTSPLCTATELLPVPGPYQALTLLDIWQCWPGREAFVHLTALAASGW